MRQKAIRELANLVCRTWPRPKIKKK